jgi:hypothetical protein
MKQSESAKVMDFFQLASFFGMELETFIKTQSAFFQFFNENGQVSSQMAQKHLVSSNLGISLEQDTLDETLHPNTCCMTGMSICRTSKLKKILLDGIQQISDEGRKPCDALLWHLILTSGRNCSLVNDVTFQYLLFTLFKDGQIIFQRDENDQRVYEIAPIRKKRVGRPRKYDLP